jgi:hypothetical protein
MGIPKLRKDGALPEGIHQATAAQVRDAFGRETARRAELMMALEEALGRARRAGAMRVLINGSFVTAKKEPGDVDMVLQVGDDFADRLKRRLPDAIWVMERVREERPKLLDLFVAVDDEEWASWAKLFAGDAWHRKKGLVEVKL